MKRILILALLLAAGTARAGEPPERGLHPDGPGLAGRAGGRRRTSRSRSSAPAPTTPTSCRPGRRWPGPWARPTCSATTAWTWRWAGCRCCWTRRATRGCGPVSPATWIARAALAAVLEVPAGQVVPRPGRRASPGQSPLPAGPAQRRAGGAAHGRAPGPAAARGRRGVPRPRRGPGRRPRAAHRRLAGGRRAGRGPIPWSSTASSGSTWPTGWACSCWARSSTGPASRPRPGTWTS